MTYLDQSRIAGQRMETVVVFLGVVALAIFSYKTISQICNLP